MLGLDHSRRFPHKMCGIIRGAKAAKGERVEASTVLDDLVHRVALLLESDTPSARSARHLVEHARFSPGNRTARTVGGSILRGSPLLET